MAKIIGKEQQEAALKEINVARKEMENTQSFLGAPAPATGQFIIKFVDANGKKQTATAFASKKEDIDVFVMQHQKRVADRVSDLSQRNHIALDPKEKSLFGMQLTQEEQDELDELTLSAMVAEEELAADSETEGETSEDNWEDETSSPTSFE